MIVTVMGVTGSGKTTVGSLLAKRLGWEFADADDFHSAANKDKMHRGIPLTDADRIPWLAAIHDYLRARCLGASKHRAGLLRAEAELPGAAFSRAGRAPRVFEGQLRTDRSAPEQRKGHFADDHILAAQFADLEEPTDALVVDISASPRRSWTRFAAGSIYQPRPSNHLPLPGNANLRLASGPAPAIFSRESSTDLAVIPPVSGRCLRPSGCATSPNLAPATYAPLPDGS